MRLMEMINRQFLFTCYYLFATIFGQSLLIWEIGQIGLRRAALEGPRRRSIRFAMWLFVSMFILQWLGNISIPQPSKKAVIILAGWFLSLFFVSKQLVPVALRLYDQAKSLHETAAAVYGDHHQRGLQASFEEIRRDKHLREAEQLYRRAAELAARQARNDLNAAAVQHQLSLLYRQQGRFAEARLSFSEALRILRHLEYLQPDRPNILAALSLNLFRLGELHHVQGEREQARSCYQQSLTLDRKLGDSSGVQQTLQLLNKLEAEHGTPSTAQDEPASVDKPLTAGEQLQNSAGPSVQHEQYPNDQA